MRGLDLVLMALLGQFTINVEQDNRVGDTKYNIHCSKLEGLVHS